MPEIDVRFVIAVAAQDDLRSIYREVADTAGISAAERLRARFVTTFNRLVAFPSSGVPRILRDGAFRIAPVQSWTVWYHWNERTRRLLVVRVLHGRMDATRYLPSA
jgi:plasmid stabilization system protein ParE